MFNKTTSQCLIVALIMLSAGAQAELVGSENLLDPTRPLRGGMSGDTGNLLLASVSDYKVSSILIRANTRVAVINSMRVAEGDRLGAAEVLSIEKNSVTLSVAGETKVIHLYGSSIKTLSASSESE